MGQVRWARELAETLLAQPLPRRWAHTQGVAATAHGLAAILGQDAELVEAAAWLHDIGYAPEIAQTGFHALDGARYLRKVHDANPRLCDLVAHHTGARYEARERGLESDLTSEFTLPPPELAEALAYCDLSTGPNGEHTSLQQRLTDILNRYEPDHPVSRATRKATAFYIKSVQAVQTRLTA